MNISRNLKNKFFSKELLVSLASAILVFDRSKYDVRFRSGSFFDELGDKLILDEIKLEVALDFN